MDVSLVMFKADGSRRDFPVDKDRVVIGRTNTCDLRIPLSSVSRQHCEVNVVDDSVRIRDLGSSNGTFHNGIRIQEAELSAGDEIGIGPVVFTLVVDGEPSEVKPVRTFIDSEDSAAGEAYDEPEQIQTQDGQMPAADAESHSPTVELDDDPIAALEALSDIDDDDDDIPLLDDDDDDQKR